MKEQSTSLLLYSCIILDEAIFLRVYGKLLYQYGKIQVGSLAGAAQLLKDNAGVQRLAQKGQKPFVAEQGQ